METLLQNKVDMEIEESKSLGIKYYPREEAQLILLKEKLMMEFITNRTQLDRREDGSLVLSVVAINCE